VRITVAVRVSARAPSLQPGRQAPLPRFLFQRQYRLCPPRLQVVPEAVFVTTTPNRSEEYTAVCSQANAMPARCNASRTWPW
jgi:hypothetical protein